MGGKSRGRSWILDFPCGISARKLCDTSDAVVEAMVACSEAVQGKLSKSAVMKARIFIAFPFFGRNFSPRVAQGNEPGLCFG